MNKIKRILFIAVAFATVMMFASCSSESYAINVSEKQLSAYCGEYTAPYYEVINDAGEIMAEYIVKLKEVKSPEGNNITIDEDGLTVNIEEEGVYEFIYTANARNVKDATLKVSFSFRPPQIIFDDMILPDYYHKGITYDIPDCEFGQDADLTKSYVKIYHEEENGAEREEIESENGKFTPPYDTGKYIVLIHSEGFKNNIEEIEYEIDAQVGPSTIPEGKIGYFDEEFGVYQLTPRNAIIEYNTEVKYGDEKGSVKITLTEGTNGYCATLKNLIQKDVSEYDYLVFRLYNPNDYGMNFIYHVWYGLTNCPAKSWTEVKVRVSDILGPTGSQEVTDLRDVTGLVFLAGKDDYTSEAGISFYISSLWAGKDPKPSEIIEGKIGYFDEEFGVSQLTPHSAIIEYSTDIKYGDEAGSVKITLRSGANGLCATMEGPMPQVDVSDYDYLVFRLYNPNNYDLYFVYDDWYGFTNCAAGKWTKVKVPVSDIISSANPSYTITSLENIKGLVFKIGKNDYTVPEGLSFHMSALWAVKDDTGPEQVIEGKIGYFDEAFGVSQLTVHTAVAEYVTDKKYGDEAGSTKITLQEGSNGLFATMDGNMPQVDVSDYDYIVMRIFNPYDYDMYFVFDDWFGFTNCAPGVWTEVKVPVNDIIASANPSHTITSLENIKGLVFKIGKFDYTVETGLTFYMSALWAVNQTSE